MSEQRLDYMKLAPEGVAAMRALEHYLNSATALEAVLRELVRLRVSQLNGCRFCIGMHTHELKQHHEPESRIGAVAEWRASSAFTERERAALAWAELLTRLSGEEISDEAYAVTRLHFDEKEMVDLTLTIGSIHAWNRLGLAFRSQWKPPAAKGDAGAGSEDRSAIKDDGGKVSVDEEMAE